MIMVIQIAVLLNGYTIRRKWGIYNQQIHSYTGTARRILKKWGGQAMLKSEKRESQKFKKRYGPRRHKLLGINKWTRKRKEKQESKAAEKETEK